MEPARTLGLALLLLPLLDAATVHAHDDRYPRQEKLRIEPEGLRVTIDHAVPRGDVARALRRIFDRDRSGFLDEKEQQALGRHLEAEALAFLALRVDGQPVAAPEVTSRGYFVGGMADADEPIAIHVELFAVAALGAGDHDVEVRDRHKDRRVTVPLEIELAAGLTWRTRPPPRPLLDGQALRLEVRR